MTGRQFKTYARKLDKKPKQVRVLGQSKSKKKSLDTISPVEAILARQFVYEGLVFEREVRFHPVRRWRFDFAFPDRRLAVEVEGGIYGHGRHQRVGGFTADCEKYNEAALLGWVVLRVTPAQVKAGAALGWVAKALAGPHLPGSASPDRV